MRGMEPELITDAKHREVLQELISREPIFHRTTVLPVGLGTI